jgi:hypothetical protein
MIVPEEVDHKRTSSQPSETNDAQTQPRSSLKEGFSCGRATPCLALVPERLDHVTPHMTAVHWGCIERPSKEFDMVLMLHCTIG